jgi:hypothetical protein
LKPHSTSRPEGRTPSAPFSSRFLRWRLAIPPEKGGWVWWIGPLLVGAFAARAFAPMLLAVAVGAFLAFCIRQPLTLATRQLRRRQEDGLAPPLAWAAGYALLLALIAGLLWQAGHRGVVALGLLAFPVFLWHLVLVYLRRDRHQLALDLSAAAALALAGPAAYWIAGGDDPATAFWVWALSALQSGASIVHMFLRLDQRQLYMLPSWRTRLRTGTVPMLAHLAAFAAAVLAASLGNASMLVVLGLAIPAVEGAWSIARPPLRPTPKQLGVRQLAVSSAAMLLLALGL